MITKTCPYKAWPSSGRQYTNQHEGSAGSRRCSGSAGVRQAAVHRGRSGRISWQMALAGITSVLQGPRVWRYSHQLTVRSPPTLDS